MNGKIALLSDGGKGGWLSRENNDYIRACKSDIDERCIFTVNNESSNIISLLADNGKYLSRYTKSGDIKETSLIMAVKTTLDEYCKFSYRYIRDGVIVMQAENGYYVTRMTYDDKNSHLIMANKRNIDTACEFSVKEIQETVPLPEDNNYYTLSGGTAIEKGADLNSLTEIGNYYCTHNFIAASLKHMPENMPYAFTLKVEYPTGINEYTSQSLRIYNTGSKYYRIYKKGSWFDWIKLY